MSIEKLKQALIEQVYEHELKTHYSLSQLRPKVKFHVVSATIIFSTPWNYSYEFRNVYFDSFDGTVRSYESRREWGFGRVSR